MFIGQELRPPGPEKVRTFYETLEMIRRLPSFLSRKWNQRTLDLRAGRRVLHMRRMPFLALNVSCLLAAVAAGCALRMPGLAQQTARPGAVVTAAMPAHPSEMGSLTFELSLPEGERRLQALPDSTDRVEIEVQSSRLLQSVKQSVYRSQFVNGKAMIVVERLPLGEVKVEARVFDSSGKQVTMGGATVIVEANKTTPVTLNLVVKEETGAVAISVDSRKVYDDVPKVVLPSEAPQYAPPTTTTVTLYPVWRTTEAPTWVDTGIVPGQGQSILIRAAGRVGYSYFSPAYYNYYEPEGCLACLSGELYSSAAGLALVGKFTPIVEGLANQFAKSVAVESQYFLVGSRYSFTAPSRGRLYLGINTWRNSAYSYAYVGGSYTADIKVQ